jgi:hypothetical protein
MRTKVDMNPKILRARGPGGRLSRLEGHHLRDVIKWPPRRRLDLVVEWARPHGGSLKLRMVLSWNPSKRSYP